MEHRKGLNIFRQFRINRRGVIRFTEARKRLRERSRRYSQKEIVLDRRQAHFTRIADYILRSKLRNARI